jgi:hypothetical protein
MTTFKMITADLSVTHFASLPLNKLAGLLTLKTCIDSFACVAETWTNSKASTYSSALTTVLNT